MLRNRIFVKKIRNIFILLMAVVIMIGIYRNIRNSRAENVIQIEMEVADKSNTLDLQTITVDATETKDGKYMVDLPKSVNTLIVTKYYLDDQNEVDMKDENVDKTIALTDEEITNKKIQISTDYDKEDATTEDGTITTTLYNKELRSEGDENGEGEGDVIATGYMPLDAKMEVTDIDLATLTSVKLPNENQTMQKAYEVSIYQEVAKQTEAATEKVEEANSEQTTAEESTDANKTDAQTTTQENETSTNNQETEIEKVEYDPSKYGELLIIKTKNEQENTTATVYSLPDDLTTIANMDIEKLLQPTEIENIDEQEYIDFEIDKNDKKVKYMLTTEPKAEDEVSDEIMNEPDTIETRGLAVTTKDKQTLRSTNNENSETSGFLGNTSIQRKNIISVTFLKNISSANSTKWDVSIASDAEGVEGYIFAWYTTQSDGKIKVFIGTRTGTIYANPNSSYLFAFLAAADDSPSISQLINNIWILDTTRVTNMSYMFAGTGYTSMTELDLGSNFNTSNVTSMESMFDSVGNSAMTTLKLGNNFDTSKVTNMKAMFANAGMEAMTSLELGNNFNTSNVTDMSYMFYCTGLSAMTTLKLGDNFNTEKVTDMSEMFNFTGNTAMTILDLGASFKNFATSQTEIFAYCGTSSCSIYIPGEIFKSIHNAKKSPSSTDTVSYTVGKFKSKATNGTLKTTNTEKKETSGFLENTSIQRQNIENVTFVNNLDGENENAWDVSAESNGSIMAWYETSNSKGALKVYIGSESTINANEDSSYLFAKIGFSDKCTATETITNISILNTGNVTNMMRMFLTMGYKSMTKLDLGENFDTSNVTNMQDMFSDVGPYTLKTFKIGDKFNTSKVTNMSRMFWHFGADAIQEFDLGKNFDTSSVTTMERMFEDAAHKSTSINLGEKFDTSKVTNMSKMFYRTGYYTLTTLDLGDKFTTKNVPKENLTEMFYQTGTQALTSIDFGPAFTSIGMNGEGEVNDFATGLGKSGAVAYVSANIYGSTTKFSGSISSGNTKLVPKYFTTWQKENVTVDTENQTMKITLRGTTNPNVSTSEYASDVTSTLTSSDIKIFIEETNITDYVDKNVETAVQTTNPRTGKKDVLQTITISNFKQLGILSGKKFKEWSGNVSIKDDYNKLVDAYGNGEFVDSYGETDIDDKVSDTIVDKNTEGTMFIDTIAPSIIFRNSNTVVDSNANTVKLVFDVTDKYYSTTNTNLSLKNLSIKIDGKEPDLTKITRSLRTEDLTETVDGTSKKVGVRYTLILSDLEQLQIKEGDKYLDYSGVISVGIPGEIASDNSGNKSVSTTITTGIELPEETGTEKVIDIVAPLIEKVETTVDAVNENKATIKFRATDKYFAKSTLTKDNIKFVVNGVEASASISNKFTSTPLTEERAVGNNISTFQYGTEYFIEIPSINSTVNQAKIKIPAGLVTDEYGNGNKETELMVYNTLKKETGEEEENGGLKNQGFLGNDNVKRQYIRKIEFQNYGMAENSQYAQHRYVATDAPSGSGTWKDLKGSNNGTVSGAIRENDYLKFDGVDDWVNLGQMSFNNNKVVLDAVISVNSIQQGEVDILNNFEAGGAGLYLLDGKPTLCVCVSGSYVRATGSTALNVGEKVRLTGIYDGNKLLLYVNGMLASKVSAAGNFGGPTNNTVMAIGTNPSGSTAAGLFSNINVYEVNIYDNVWDISAQQDGSILAFAQESNTSSGNVYDVYVTSESEIFANQNSGNLFSTIATSSQASIGGKIINNIELLNTSNVTNMAGMFSSMGHGYGDLILGDNFDTSNVTRMDTMFERTYIGNLDLGSKFDTSNVTDMNLMFELASFATIDLGDNFDTSKVTSMQCMFQDMDITTSSELNLGDKFDTSNVTEMGNMFANTGYTAMTKINLGPKFDTSNVTDMSSMFSYTGYTAMTSLDLGDKFDTSNVTNMDWMFYGCGYTALTSLDLGDKFSVSKVTSMSNMFKDAGAKAMTSLDLGAKFTKVTNTNAFDGTGKSGEIVIQAPEAIYENKTNFKLGTNSTIKAELTTGTITPKYKTEWIKERTTIDQTDAANPKIKVQLRGTTNQEISAEEYTSDVTSTLTADNIKISIDGTDITNLVTKEVSAATQTTNSKTNAKDILQTVTLSNFEEASRKVGKNYKEWSGMVTVELAQVTLKDQYGNGNTDLAEDGTRTDSVIKDTEQVEQNTDDVLFTDFVKPEWTFENLNFDTANNQMTADLIGRDKYYAGSTLTANNIKLYIGNQEVTGNITKTLSSPEELSEERNGQQVPYGVKYTLTITGLESDQKYSKLTIAAGTLTDKSGNANIENNLMFYSTLRATNTETRRESGFLGNTSIQRQNIENVTFVSNTANANSTKWDVSENQDGSILAWYETSNSNGALKVYIGSEGDINANQDSSYLFSCIGYSTMCTATETITNLQLLNTSDVTNMGNMFLNTGYRSMKSLKLGDNFITKQVTNMENMFGGMGYTSMTSLELGKNFDTSNVTNMMWMFANCGYTAMTSLELGENFDTSNVTDMNTMFYFTGHNALTTLKLGDKFNTSKVKDMHNMFQYAGNMSMTLLDLGNGFTNIPDGYLKYQDETTFYWEGNAYDGLFDQTGKSGCIIYVPGEIFKSIHYAKLNQTATTTVNYSRGKFRSNATDGTIKVVNTETLRTSGFLGNTSIQRQNIENVTFVNNLDGENETTWDVSAESNGSIMAWYVTNNSNGALKVYIGSEITIKANEDSSYLFAWIGFGDKCTATEAITNISLLNTSNATNMKMMFAELGYKSMTKLDLGDNFDTSSVTNMQQMFADTGPFTLKTFNIGSKFNTSKVTNMSTMFWHFGMGALEELNLGDKFDTSSVTDMSEMFMSAGERIKSLSLGNKFDTSNVTDMHDMFYATGYYSMTSLSLGDEFDTSNVTDMEGMFAYCGYSAMTSLDLGDKFTTKNVPKNRVNNMFNNTGNQALTSIDFGPAFTSIGMRGEGEVNDFATGLGKSGAIAYVSANIYGSKTKFSGSIPSGNAKLVQKYFTTWQKEDVKVDAKNQTMKITLRGTTNPDVPVNEYISDVISTVSSGDIQIFIDGTDITKYVEENIETAVQTTNTRTGAKDVLQTITISSFKQLGISSGKAFQEWSGNISIKVAPSKLIDAYGNIELTDLYGELDIDDKVSDTTVDKNTEGTLFADVIEPSIIFRNANTVMDENANTIKLVFDVTDKYYSTTNVNLSLSNLTIKIDGKEPDWTKISRELRAEDITKTVDGSSKKVGVEYTLTLSNVEQLQIKEGEKYLEYSGVITIGIPAGIAVDNSNNKNVATTITTGIDLPEGTGTENIVDVVNPLIEKMESSADVAKGKATVKFKVTDKYFSKSTLTKDNIKVLINGTETTSGINKTLSSTNLTEERASGNTTTTVQYGIEYTVNITGIAADVNQVKLKIPADLITDKSGNGNKETDLMMFNALKSANYEMDNGEESGFLGNTSIQRQNIENVTFLKGGLSSATARSSYSAKNNTGSGHSNSATTWKDLSGSSNGTINGATWHDDYLQFDGVNDWVNLGQMSFENNKVVLDITFSANSIQQGEVDILNNCEIGGAGIVLIDGVPRLDVMISGNNGNYTKIRASEPIKVGEKVRITGMYDGKNVLLYVNGVLVDKTEKEGTLVSPQNNTVMAIGANPAGNTVNGNFANINVYDVNIYDNVWDVSAQQDGSILAWSETSNSNGAQKVYIASEDDIFANYDSGQLFKRIGSGDKCTATETITNINLLNTNNVTNMSSMFASTGKNAMTNLDLGDNFNTSNVTDMGAMFDETGFTAMTNLDLGDNFNTSNVTDMGAMFRATGYNAMTSLDLGENFDTSNVTNMSGMFVETGYTAMKSLDLGEKFDTSNVTGMGSMFNQTGFIAMTNLKLGEKFDTSNVTDMSFMFVGTGYTAMKSLDLGPAFTKIAKTNSNMFKDTGTSGTLVIQAPEAIYKDSTHFKLSKDSTTTIELTTGTINPKYRTEWIKEGTTIDKTDATNPKIKVQLRGTTNREVAASEYISDVTSTLAANKIKISIDGTDITNIVTKEIGTATQTANTRTGAKDVLQTITLSKFEEVTRRTGKSYLEWSGNIVIEVAQGTLSDTTGPEFTAGPANNRVTKKITYGNSNMELAEDGTRADNGIKDEEQLDKNTENAMFVDFIKPEITYVYADGDINKTDKTLTVEFSVTDKYFSNTLLTESEIADKISVKILDTDAQIPNAKITKTVTKVEDITETRDGSAEPVKIGEKYKLVVSGLEQQTKDGNYKDYSGPMSVTLPEGMISDKSENKNISKTITIGVNEPDGTGSKVNVDVITPVWEVTNKTVNVENQTATMTLKGTDKYFASSKLTQNQIKVLVDGAETSGTTVSLSSATNLTEPRTVNGQTSTVQYGVQYTLSVSGFPTNKNQVKIRIPAGMLKDSSNNDSKETDIILYNALKVASGENTPASGFLGNTSIQRQNIDSVTFVENLANVNNTKWDVSAIQDGTIMAWYETNSNGTIKAYIGSDDIIFANKDSSWLFAYIGYSSKCTSTTSINNLNKLNTYTTTDMTGMFMATGYNNMTTLDLGSNFNTSSVIVMKEMFAYAGYNKMTTIKLGNNFSTANVKDMSWMFANFGFTALTSLDISQFDTSKVTNMEWMFADCGYTQLKTLNLGINFNTENVVNMSGMFEYLGYTKLESLDLGSKFDTTNVADMSMMFKGTGHETLRKLDLGDKFEVSKVTDMEGMFQETGNKLMTSLDLGPRFTKIASSYADIFNNTGKSGALVIQSPEAIFSNTTNFKLGTDSTTTIALSSRTINPKYRTEWEKTIVTVDTTNSDNPKINIGITGTTNTEVAANEYSSTVTSTITADDVKVLIDGTDITDIVTVSMGTALQNGETVLQPITISNFEEVSRREGKSYKEWSGNITLEIAQGTLTDEYGNKNTDVTSNGERADSKIADETLSDKNTENALFADFIKPEFTYVYADSNINKTDKTLTVEFSVVDKYFSNVTANATEIANNIKVTLLDTNTQILDSDITKGLSKVEDITEEREGYATPVKIGEKYKLIIGGLEQPSKDDVYSYKDYSGPMSITIPAGIAIDKSGNSNISKTITIGVNEPDNSGNQEIVDVVSPEWKTQNFRRDSATGTITVDLIGTDKYFASESLTADGLKFYIDGQEVNNMENVEKTLSNPEILKEERNGEEVQYGVKYTLTIKGLAVSGNQGKIKIPAGTLTDKSGNTSKEMDIMLYTTLVSTSEEQAKTDGFLGNTSIQRQNIENVTFVNNVVDANATKWDVSAAKDGSILAWYETSNSNGALKVYIGSDNGIFANVDSSYLFAWIGYDSKCKSTETITNIDLLNTSNVTNMKRMFFNTGYTAMKTLDLGNNFDTRSVTNMIEMFKEAGYTAMTTLNLGSMFDTSNVTSMNSMFAECGYKLLKSLDLGKKFDTSNVIDMGFVFAWTGVETLDSINLGDKFDTSKATNMEYMFCNTGWGYLTKLDLGDKFATSNVTSMKYMFLGTGYKTLKTLNLGDKFDTSNVTNMENMFGSIGVNTLTSLDLGNKFNTSKVTNMKGMFNWTGNGSMTSLNLGPAFTKIAETNTDVFNGVGKSGSLVIQASEAIYSNKTTFKLGTDSTTTIALATGTINPKYRTEWILEGTAVDQTDIQNQKLNITLRGTTNTALTANEYVSDVTSLLTANKIKISIDGKDITSLITTEIGETTQTANTRTGAKDVLQTIILSNFEQVGIPDGKSFKEWSGNIKLEVEQGTLSDTTGPEFTIGSGENQVTKQVTYGNKNMVLTSSGARDKHTFTTATVNKNTSKSLFADTIAPAVVFRNANTVEDDSSKSVKLVFDVTDKYYSSTNANLTLNDLTIKIDNEEPDWSKVTKRLSAENLTETVDGSSKKVGVKYTLTLGNLEQLQVKEGDKYLDYSGVITIAIKADKAVDNSGNKNLATTITTGIELPEGTGTEKVIDVVDPLVEKIESSADVAKGTASVKFKVTDKYFAKSTLTKDNIKVVINGTETTSGITKTLTPKNLTEERASGNTTTTVQYGVEYTVTVTGIAANVNQVKLRVPADIVTDESGNSNKETDLIMFNALRVTNQEYSESSGFLGNTNIQRKNIENVTFKNSIADANDTKWDVSAQQDGSIIAWNETSNSNGAQKVYIASEDDIFGNYDSSYLFDMIASSDKCTSAETITNINLLNTNNVTNMSSMFASTGKNAMTNLDLGDNFNTSNVTDMGAMFDETGFTAMTNLDLGDNFITKQVTNMENMFGGTGFTAMTNLDLGDNFNTSNVTDMTGMFRETGFTAMTSINLGDKFDTSNVTEMDYMFFCTGYIAMTSLDLGDKFDTSNVTDMTAMFSGAGYTAMTSLDLGDKFDTSNVTNMREMFEFTGHTAMTSLNLGDKFDTSNVFSMSRMFWQTGYTEMTILDLGPAFTKIPNGTEDFISGCGKKGAVIYAPEAIYQNSTNLKLGTDSTTTIQYSDYDIENDQILDTPRGKIIPKYRTEWLKEVTTIDTSKAEEPKINIQLRGTTNTGVKADEYISDVESTLKADKIKVSIDGTDITDIVTKEVGTATQTANTRTGAKDVLQTVTLSNFEEVSRRTGKSYLEWSGNITIEVAQGTLSDTKGPEFTAGPANNRVTKQITYGNKNMEETVEGERADNKIFDTTEVDKNTTNSMFADFIKPEFTYVYADDNIDMTNKTLTVEFSVTDKYFNSTLLTEAQLADKISVKLLDTDTQIPNDKITKTVTKVEDITETRDGKEVKIGEKYKMLISGLQQQTSTGNYNNYSGPMSIIIPKEIASDKSGNKNVEKIITIGINEPDHTGNKVTVDVVDPEWKTDNINIDKANKMVTLDLLGTDKYYASNSLTADKIKVFIDGEEVTTTVNVVKELKEVEVLTEPVDLDNAVGLNRYGIKYKLTLSNWEEAEKQTGKDFFEWSGTTKIQIEKDTITDKSGNTSNAQEFELGHVDFIKPKIEKVSSTKNKEASTETITFNVIDKYLDIDKKITEDDIKVYVDKEETTGISKRLTKLSDITATVNKTTQVVGQQYQLVLSNFEQTRTSIDTDRNYTDWSGTVSIDVLEGAAKDTSDNTNETTTIVGDFVDYIKPEVTYKYAESDIDYGGKTFTMSLEVTDKYFAESSTLTTANLKNYLTIKVDGVDITNNDKVTKEIIAAENVTAGTSAKPINKTIDGTVQTGLVNQVIGKRYTLKLSNLEQTIKTEEYMDYSGIITVALKEGMTRDTSNNSNVVTTITSGVDFPGGTGEGTVVDVVDPIWEQVGTATAAPIRQTASIILKGSDKYLDKAKSKLTADKIKVEVNGQIQTEGITLKVEEDTSVTLTYGRQYKISVSGFVSDAYQVKLILPPGSLYDDSGNTNKETSFILYSCLRETSDESSATSGFLGNTSIQRQKIEKIIFDDYADYTKDNRWDVSAQEDGSIIAWYETTSRGTYIVHIGSNIIMNGNVNSSHLFSYIGYDSACAETSEETNKIIENLNLIHFDSVTNMSYMFYEFGDANMKSFSLGSNFDTSSVTDMNRMFCSIGNEKMTSLDLGDKFDTSNVTDMSGMFFMSASNNLKELNLGEKFDTRNTTDMSYMFDGMYTVETIKLGYKFDTSNVKNMSYMFWACQKLTSLDLGEKFDTSNVTNMNSMFQGCGKAMTSLDLGDKFYTSKVTDMRYMFEGTGSEAMTVLDLGTGFTKIAEQNDDMFTNCGTSDLVIYAPELIYSSETSFKLGH